MKKLSGVSDKGLKRLSGLYGKPEPDAEFIENLRQQMRGEDPPSDVDEMTDEEVLNWHNSRLLDEEESNYPFM